MLPQASRLVVFMKQLLVKTRAFIRIILYALSVYMLKLLLLVTAFLLGFGSGSDHKNEEIGLHILFFALNALVCYLIQLLFNNRSKIELFLVLTLAMSTWIVMYLYYN